MRNLKKVLALVLALVMTMSLVTIANAAEFSDADDINYTEAVDVLTALKVIDGVGNNTYNPAGTLTREQAAKIITVMMLGDNAEKLGSTTSSFKDVASDRWSAPYIEYCASLGIIAGNGDGTYNPAGTLTGYAFAKMLLCALGYKADVEGFVGAGWNLKVAAMASKAGLLNDLVGFVGSEPVSREEAAQLALNTLKATLVEYDGTTIDVSTGDATVSVGNTKYSYVVSNNAAINQNINDDDAGNQANYYTLEFGEQHFPNLKLEDTNARDSFGNPANHWSLSNVTIGKYSKTPEYVFTAGVSGNTNLDKLKALGLNGFKVANTTTLVVNGASTTPFSTGNLNTADNMAALLPYVNNGSLVRVFISDSNADVIEAITVVESQIMQVNRVTDSLVTLKRVENSGKTVNAVDNSNSNFEFLSGLKADDYVVVIPVADGNSYSVADAYLPTTATGAITKVSLNKGGNTVGVTVDSTPYEMSNNWTAEGGIGNLTSTSANTTLQSTVYVDQYGYVIYAEDVKASTNYFVFDELYQNIVNNKLHYIAQGWDLSGNQVTLDFGTTAPTESNTPLAAGTVYAYAIASSNTDADWVIDATKVGTTIIRNIDEDIEVNHTKVSNGTTANAGAYFTDGVTFLFPTKDGGDVLSLTAKSGVQKVTSDYTYVLNSDGNVMAVVVTDDLDVEVSSNILYVEKETATTTDSSGKLVSVFTAYIDGVKAEKLVADRRVTNDSFYAYAEDNGVYKLSSYTKGSGSATSVASSLTLNRNDIKNEAYVDNGDIVGVTGDLNFSGAVVVDLTSGFGYNLGSIKDMAQQVECNTYTISIIYNDSSASSNQGRVSYVYITNIGRQARTLTVAADDTFEFSLDSDFSNVLGVGNHTVYDGQTIYVRSTTPLQELTAGAGMTIAAAPVAAPTTTNDLVVYSAIVTGNIDATNAATNTTNWYTVGLSATAAVLTYTNGVCTFVLSGDTALVEKTSGTATFVVTATVTAQPTGGGNPVAKVTAADGSATIGTPTLDGTDGTGGAVVAGSAAGEFDRVANTGKAGTATFKVEISNVTANTTLKIGAGA